MGKHGPVLVALRSEVVIVLVGVALFLERTLFALLSLNGGCNEAEEEDYGEAYETSQDCEKNVHGYFSFTSCLRLNRILVHS